MSQVQPILIKYSSVQGKAPAVADLQLRELALNTYDGKLYMRKNNGVDSIVQIGSAADTLGIARTIAATGDATWSVSFDGSSNVTAALTLAASGATAGQYTKVTVDAKGRVTAGTAIASSDVTTALGYTPVNPNTLAAANGVATLDGTGKLTTAQIPASLVGAVVYQGTWNASTNTPTLTSGSGTKGQYYKVSVAGTTSIDGHASWTLGDTIIYNGSAWDKIDGADTEVVSVFGRIGAVVMLSSDVTTALGFTPYNATNPAGFISGNQNINVTGDATGSGATAIALTLAASGVTAGTYTKITVDAKGRATVGANLAVSDVPSLPWSKITSGTPTTLAGYGITDAQPLNGDLTAIGGIVATSGLLKKTAANTWSLDTNAYLTGNQTITHTGDVTGSGTTSIPMTLAATGVGAGQYTKVTVDTKGRVTAGTAISSGDVTTALGFTPANAAIVGAANGIATLDGTGRLPISQLTAAVVGAVVYQGVWNASTNTPALVSGTGTKGNYYKVSVAGSTSIDGLSQWNLGDTIIFNGSTWDKLDGLSSEVVSVFGRVGAVTMTSGDVTTALGFTPYNATNPAGFISGNQTITATGDATGSGTTAIALTLANTGVGAGTYGDSTHVGAVTVDAKGRVTTASSVSIAFPVTSVFGQTGAIGNLTGDVTTTNSSATTLAASGVTAGTYTKITVDAKGRATVGASLASGDVTTALGYTPVNKAGDTMSGTLTVTGSVNATANMSASNFIKSVAVGLTAAGTTQGTGLALTSAINVVSTSTAGTGLGVVLPTATAGILVTVVNVSANAISVYPPTGVQIDSLGANVAFSLGVASKLEFVAVSATQWYAMTGVYA